MALVCSLTDLCAIAWCLSTAFLVGVDVAESPILRATISFVWDVSACSFFSASILTAFLGSGEALGVRW